MKIGNIVVAMDFSEPSETALRLATSLARGSGATLHIVHVRQPFTMYHLDRKYGHVKPFPELPELEQILKRVVPGDRTVAYQHWLFSSEDPAKEILTLAREQQADFIMMGTHGRTGLSRLLTGSVAEAVLRHAECPVLTVKQPQAALIEPASGWLQS